MQQDVDYTIFKDDKKCKLKADKKMVKALDTVPKNQRQWGHWLARNAKLALGVKPPIKKKTTEKGGKLQWQEKLADELHKPVKHNFSKNRVIAHRVDDIRCSDLVDMQKLSKWNKGYKYLLMVLDIFSKYGWLIPQKKKTGLEVSKALESIFIKNKPKML